AVTASQPSHGRLRPPEPAPFLRLLIVSANGGGNFSVAKNSPSAADTTTPTPMNPVRLRRHGAAILAGAVGIALNLLPLPAVARLVPGRIATLPIAMLHGPWYGVAAALLATLPLARNLPLLLVVFAFEALLVGVFARRG